MPDKSTEKSKVLTSEGKSENLDFPLTETRVGLKALVFCFPLIHALWGSNSPGILHLHPLCWWKTCLFLSLFPYLYDYIILHSDFGEHYSLRLTFMSQFSLFDLDCCFGRHIEEVWTGERKSHSWTQKKHTLSKFHEMLLWEEKTMMSVSSVCHAETHLPCICLDSLISPPCSTNYEDVEMSKDIPDKYIR